MSLIKQAIVFKAEIPTDVDALNKHLKEHQFNELLPNAANGAGFVNVSDEHSLIAPFHGGLAFRVRYDEKILPASVIRAEIDKVATKIHIETGRKPGKKERAEIKERVIHVLTRLALSRTVASVICFYHTESGYLIIPTTNKKFADIAVTLLISAVGSVKTETIHVSNVKHGLTTRLKKWLRRDIDNIAPVDIFGELQPSDEVALVGDGGRKIAVKMESLDAAEDALKEALTKGMEVTSLGFNHEGIEFRLTHDFRLRGIKYPVVEGDNKSALDSNWEADATLQVSTVRRIIDGFCEMLAYKEQAEGDKVAA